MMKSLGEKLRILRQRQGLSQAQLSNMLGVNQTYIGKMERDEKTPNLAMLVKIADVFKICLDKLVRDELDLD